VTEVPGLRTKIPEGALKEVGCGLCGSAEQRLRFADGPFRVVTCARCDLTYVTPRLTDASLLALVYDAGYWRSNAAKERGYTDYCADETLYTRTYQRRLAVVRRHFARPGRVLDVGCAAGFFLSVVRDAGWEITGLEPSAAIRAVAERRLGVENVRGGLLGGVDLEAGSYDLVTLWDVIEHVPDTIAALTEIRRLLKPDGRLLIETQNVKSLAARLLGRRWQHYKHAEHIYHFHPATLALALERAGFEVLENRAALGGKYVSPRFVAERAGRVHPLLSFVLAPLKAFPRAALYVNLLDEMIVVARPRH
jgi:SAM-dependent methyltransferase